jgi:short-subunit dehydrogenase
LVNNAGFGVFKQATEISTSEWDSIFETNVKGTFLFCRETVPLMKSAGKGHIINIASDVAKRVFDGGSLYCASKYAQDAFSMALRKEVRKDKIKVSVVYSEWLTHIFIKEKKEIHIKPNIFRQKIWQIRSILFFLLPNMW